MTAKHDATIIRLAPYRSYAQIAKMLGWKTKAAQGRGWKLGIRRKAKIRDQIPVPNLPPTPADSAITKLLEKWT